MSSTNGKGGKGVINAIKTLFVKPKGATGRMVPKSLKLPSDRDRLAQEICIEIEASISQYGNLGDRITRNEQLYRNQDGFTAVDFGPDAPQPRHVPIMQPKIDGTIGDIYLAITGLTPYVQAIPLGGPQDAADRVQSDLQLLADKGRFDMALWMWVKYALFGCGNLRARFAEVDTDLLPTVSGTVDMTTGDKKFGCFEFDVVHLSDLIVYPPALTKISRLKTVGHRMPEMRVQEIRELQGVDVFFSDVEVFGQDALSDQYPHGRDRNYDLTSSSYAIEYKDKSCNLYELIRKMDPGETGKESYWRVVVDLTHRKLLDIEPYPYTVPHYFPMRFDVEQGSFWPSGSFAQNLQAIQLNINDDMNILALGNRMSAIGALIIPKGAFPAGKVHFNAGDIIESTADVKDILPIHVQFQANQLQWLIQMWIDLADSVSRKSQLATGQQLKSGATATEADKLAMADQAAQTQFVRFASEAIEDLWSFMYQLYVKHYKALKNTFGTALQATPEDLKHHYRMEVNGKTSGNTQSALMNKLSILDQMAQRPTSQFDAEKVEEQIALSLQLPFNPLGLKKDPAAAVQAFLANPDNVRAMLADPNVQMQIMRIAQQLATQMAPAIATGMVKASVHESANELLAEHNLGGLDQVSGQPGMGSDQAVPGGPAASGPSGVQPVQPGGTGQAPGGL